MGSGWSVGVGNGEREGEDIREACELAANAETGVVAGDDGEHKRSDDEATNLNWLTADDFDESNGEEVSRDVSGSGDDQVTESSDEEGVVFVAALGKANETQEDGLVQVDTVEGHINEEPGGRSTDEDLEVAPLGEVGGECGPARCLEICL